jgi:hypothetical protein
MSHIKNFKDWFRVYESAGFKYQPGMAIFEATITPGALYAADTAIENLEGLSTKLDKMTSEMSTDWTSLINGWKKLIANKAPGDGKAETSNVYTTWFEGSKAGNLDKAQTEFSAFLADTTKYTKPSFSIVKNDFVINNAKGRKVPFTNGSLTWWINADNLLMRFNATNILNMLVSLNDHYPTAAWASGKTVEQLGSMAWDKIKDGGGIGKWYWPDAAVAKIVAPAIQRFLSWKDALAISSGSKALSADSLGGGIKAGDTVSDPKGMEKEILVQKFGFYTIASVEQGAGNEYTKFETTSVQVPVGGGKGAVAVKDDKQSLLGSSGLFAQGSKTPVPAKAAGQLEALQKILSQYSNITSIKVQGSASWEWTNGNTRDDAQNLALAKIRAQWFIDQLNVGTNKVATMWMPTEVDKVVNGVKQVVGEGAVVQPTNDVKTAPDWRVTNFFITGDKVTENTLPEKWITVTETGDITLKYDKVTITEHILTVSFTSPGLITSKGWGQEKGKKDIKSELKQSTKWDDLKAGQEIVINDKSDPPKPVGGGVDGKQIFVVGEGTEKNTLKVKLVTTKDGQKSEREIDNVIKDRYLREVKPKPVEGEDNL